MKQTKINRGLHLFGLALRVTTLDDETRLELTTRRAFKNDELAHWAWSLFAFVFWSALLTGCLVLPIHFGGFDDYTTPDLAEFFWYGFIWLLWCQNMRE